MTIRFEPRDLWVGLFWDEREDGLHVFICPIPCIVLHFRWTLEVPFDG